MATLFTPEQVKELFCLKSTATVFRLFDDGALGGVVLRSGKRKRIIRFRQEDLDKFLASRAQKAA